MTSRVQRAVLAGLVLLGLSACGDEDPEPRASAHARGACALLTADQAKAALDVDEVSSTDESNDLGGGPSDVLSCRWTGSGEGPALLLVAREAASPEKAAGQVSPFTATCDGASALDVEGVTGYACPGASESSGPETRAAWDTVVVTVSFAASRAEPRGDEAVRRLNEVVGALHTSLTARSFDSSS